MAECLTINATAVKLVILFILIRIIIISIILFGLTISKKFIVKPL